MPSRDVALTCQAVRRHFTHKQSESVEAADRRRNEIIITPSPGSTLTEDASRYMLLQTTAPTQSGAANFVSGTRGVTQQLESDFESQGLRQHTCVHTPSLGSISIKVSELHSRSVDTVYTGGVQPENSHRKRLTGT
ncbi:unnamed protein product [Pleuronectes platessa]|uniref:Uncharacterized protein n=1 Tax=Pleuronectes platessa TaxID=8262 RepID=A0A9N7VV15_PLEPL|nr:unnamed protein product [Pleuronectes platessa]